MTQNAFYPGDYAVFGLTVLVSLGIGVYYALSGGRQKTTSEYLVGGRSMSFLPVAISLLVSFESSIMMLGFPAEGYIYGIQIIWSSAGFWLSQLLSIYIMVPLIHPLKITSAFEYLELRFQSRSVRLISSMLGMLTYAWYMGIVLFGPAVALEAVTGFPQWMSIAIICLVAVVYTSLGGMKAVIWTDVFQATVMLAGVLAILIKGTVDVGGPAQVWHLAERGGRLNFWNFSTDLTTRHTFWNLFVGSFIRGFGMVFNQSTIQRISSTKSLQQAKWVLMVVSPAFFVTLSMAVYEGIVAYAYYQTKGCDPFESKILTNPNQIMPYTVMDIFQSLPGMPGLFLASLFSASLSTLSTGLSSLSAMVWADLISPHLGQVSEIKATIIAKVSVVFFGAAASGIAVLVSLIGGPLTQITGTLLSSFGGPLTGIFFLGCFFPRASAKGTLIGALIGFALTFWISMGMSFSKDIKRTPWLPPASTEFCPVTGNTTDTSHLGNISRQVNASHWLDPSLWTTVTVNTTTPALLTTATPDMGLQGIEKIYEISYQWLGLIGIFGTILFGLLFSILTGENKPGDVDPRLLVAISDIFFFWLPASLRQRISSLGPQFIKEEYKSRFPDPAKKPDRRTTEMEARGALGNEIHPDGLDKTDVTSFDDTEVISEVDSKQVETDKDKNHLSKEV